jgi:hypothetical protein
MNAAVDSMNEVLRRAVERAGSQVHFVDYDSYVDMIGGRFCQPGQDESAGKGANLQDLFFYQMESSYSRPKYHQDLKRRQSDEVGSGEGSTLNELYGAMIQAAIDENPEAALQDDNASNDLEAKVDEIDEQAKIRRDGGSQQLQASPVGNGMPGTAMDDRPHTLNEIYAAMIQKSLEENPGLVLNPDNVNSELEFEVVRFKIGLRRAIHRRQSAQAPQEASNVRRSQTETDLEKPRTLNEMYAALIQAALEEDRSLALDSDNVDAVLEEEVRKYKTMLRRAVKQIPREDQGPSSASKRIPITGRRAGSSPPWRNGTTNWNGTAGTAPPRSQSTSTYAFSNNTNLGTKMFLESTPQGGDMRLASGPATPSSSGTIIANQTHAMLRSGRVVEKLRIAKLVVSDMTSRVFHPTRFGHALIANLILYQIRAVVAEAAGKRASPQEDRTKADVE